MDKLIKVSQPGFGLVPFEDRKERKPLLALEKRSDARSGQLRWLEEVNRINPQVVDWLRSNPLDHDKFVYTLVVPLGADESWEETVNGDAFERYHLETENPEWGHKSFENYGVAYQHHRNNDPSIGYGDLPFVTYDKGMDRCEGIWRLDRDKAKQVGAERVLSKIEDGDNVDVSMGCRVKFDRCSLCGHEAKTPAEYCEHVRNPGFGHIDPVTHRKMRVFNPHPKFFDLSAVLVKAAPEALVLGHMTPDIVNALSSLSKVSSTHAFVVPSAILAAQVWGREAAVYERTKSSSQRAVKLSDMVKEVPVLEASVIHPLQEMEEPLSKDLMKRACMDQATVPAAISTLSALGVVLSPQEFVDVLAVSRDEDHLSHACPLSSDIESAFDFADGDLPWLQPAGFNPGMALKLFDRLEDRSVFFPFLRDRILSPKKPAQKGESPSIRIDIQVNGVPMAHLYASYIKTLARKMGSHLREVLLQYPSLFDRAIERGALTALEEKGSVGSTDKLSQLHAQAVLPSTYVLARVGKGKDPKMVLSSVRDLHVPGVEVFFGGLIRGQRA